MAKNRFRTAFDGMVNARQRQANTYVAGFLLALDDETLTRAGYSRAKLRAGRPVSQSTL